MCVAPGIDQVYGPSQEAYGPMRERLEGLFAPLRERVGEAYGPMRERLEGLFAPLRERMEEAYGPLRMQRGQSQVGAPQPLGQIQAAGGEPEGTRVGDVFGSVLRRSRGGAMGAMGDSAGGARSPFSRQSGMIVR